MVSLWSFCHCLHGCSLASCRYVGGSPGKIDLYVGKEVVKRNIPMADAPDALIQLIKASCCTSKGVVLEMENGDGEQCAMQH